MFDSSVNVNVVGYFWRGLSAFESRSGAKRWMDFHSPEILHLIFVILFLVYLSLL